MTYLFVVGGDGADNPSIGGCRYRDHTSIFFSSRARVGNRYQLKQLVDGGTFATTSALSVFL